MPSTSLSLQKYNGVFPSFANSSAFFLSSSFIFANLFIYAKLPPAILFPSYSPFNPYPASIENSLIFCFLILLFFPYSTIADAKGCSLLLSKA